MAEDLNSGLPWTNPASSQSKTWTQGLRIASSALLPLSHPASYPNQVTYIQHIKNNQALRSSDILALSKKVFFCSPVNSIFNDSYLSNSNQLLMILSDELFNTFKILSF